MANDRGREKDRPTARCGPAREPDAVEQLAALLEPHTRAQRVAVEAFVELRDDLAELREQLRELREPPAPPPDGYIALKVAAWRLGASVETLRRRACTGEVCCSQRCSFHACKRARPSVGSWRGFLQRKACV
jgi:hypothetical protein